jgi:hypothetical protein
MRNFIFLSLYITLGFGMLLMSEKSKTITSNTCYVWPQSHNKLESHPEGDISLSIHVLYSPQNSLLNNTLKLLNYLAVLLCLNFLNLCLPKLCFLSALIQLVCVVFDIAQCQYFWLKQFYSIPQNQCLILKEV